MTSEKEEQRLYVVYVDGAEEDPMPDLGEETARALNEHLFLVLSSKTQSRLYHDIKYRVEPGGLFVAALSDDPKFKGMDEGALKWLRGL